MSRKLVALILSGMFPGLGQLYSRDWTKGSAFVLADVGLSWVVTRRSRVIWIWSVDAWQRA